MRAASMMSRQYFGRQNEYTISFTKEADGCWYVDYPDWPFDHHNLMMVQNADALCEILSYDGTHTKIKVCVNIVSRNVPIHACAAASHFMSPLTVSLSPMVRMSVPY